MKNRLRILLAAFCCLLFFQAARAVSTVTDLSYYEPTNSIRVTATTYFDYDTWCYYNVSHWGQVLKNDEQLGDIFVGTMYDGIDAYNELYFPYDPNADYTVEAYPNLTLKVRHDYGDTYEDYYDYVQWTSQEPVNYPNWFDFYGPGPDVQIDGTSILLGEVYSLFTEGGLAGEPDHVKVVGDSGQTDHDTDCGFVVRTIQFQAVDQLGRRATRGLIWTKERFWDARFGGTGGQLSYVISSCNTSSPDIPTACQPSDGLGGKWNDILFAGNDQNCTAPCGLPDFLAQWSWCPRGKPEKPLTMNLYHITNSQVLINGHSESLVNSQLH